MRRFILFAALVTGALAQSVPTTQTWTGLSAHGAPVEAFQYDKTTYVNSLNAVCWLGGYNEILSTEPNQAINCYSYAENRFFVLNVGGQFHSDSAPSGGHSVGHFNYLASTDSIYYETDSSGSNVGLRFFGRFAQFSIAGRQHRDYSSTGTNSRPWLSGLTQAGGGCADQSSGKIIMFPTYTAGGSVQPTILNTSNNTLTAASTTGQPPTTLNFFAAECINGKAYFFGGQAGGGTDTVWKYDFTANTWASIAPATRPSPRSAAGFACSTVDNICLMAGGSTVVGGTAKTDTWVFDLTSETWTQMFPANSYHGHSEGQFDKLRYDPVSNVFIMIDQGGSSVYADGTFGYSVSKVYVYPYSTALAYGRTANTYTPTTGSLNATSPTATSNSALGSQAFAWGPSLALNGTSFVASWAETANWFAAGTCNENPKPRVKSISSTGTPTDLTSNPCASLVTTASGAVYADHSISAVVSGTPWEVHEEWNNSGFQSRTIAKSYGGGTWSGGAIGCFTSTCGNNYRQSPVAFASVNNVPFVAVIENDHSVDNPIYLYVARNTGTWGLAGTGKLNNNSGTGSQVIGAALAPAGGSNVYACWAEAVIDPAGTRTMTTNPQIFCKLWNGSTWSTIISGATLNRTSTSIAGPPSATYVNSKLYVAWTERTPGGVAKLHAISWDGASVVHLGGAALNVNATTGYAYRPSLTNDGTNVYIAWPEQADTSSKVAAYVKKWDTASFSQLGSAIAASTSNGSVGQVSIVASATVSPTMLLSEVNAGSMRQMYTKQWDGVSAWGAIGAAPPACPASPSFITTTGAVAESALLAKPALGASVSDSTYGNCITRVSDSTTLSYDHAVPIYSNLHAWNSDGTKILLAGGFVLDASTYSLIRTVSANDPRWSPIDPDTIYYTSGNQFRKVLVSTGVSTTLRTFPEYQSFATSQQLEAFSRDGRWTMLIGYGTSGVYGTGQIFSYDIINDVKSPTIPFVGANCGEAAWVKPSPTGAYAIVSFGGGSALPDCGIQSYNINTMAYIGKVGIGQQHGDLAVDQNGVEWLVQFAQGLPYITKSRIPSGYDDRIGGDPTGETDLMGTGWTIHGHISCRALDQNWCLVSSHNESAGEDADAWTAFERELYKLHLDSTVASTHVERVAHNRSMVPYAAANCAAYAGGFQGYWSQPHASLNHSGTKAIWGSTWGNNCTVEAYTVDLGTPSTPAVGASIQIRGAIRGTIR
jgi:hypothetical protein